MKDVEKTSYSRRLLRPRVSFQTSNFESFLYKRKPKDKNCSRRGGSQQFCKNVKTRPDLNLAFRKSSQVRSSDGCETERSLRLGSGIVEFRACYWIELNSSSNLNYLTIAYQHWLLFTLVQDRQPACKLLSKPASKLLSYEICSFVINYRKLYVECCTEINLGHKCWTVPGINGARKPLCYFNSFNIYSLLFLVAHSRI